MLNRRNLRIKVMQNLFALQQCIEANYQLCIENIGACFAPDLNSMEVQNKPQLAARQKEAVELFEKAFAEKSTPIRHDDKLIEKSVNDALLFFSKQVKKDTTYFYTSVVTETAGIYGQYISVLSLASAFSDTAEEDKKTDHKNFITNPWIKALHSSDALKKDSVKLNQHWNDSTGNNLVRGWFRDVLKPDTEYQGFIEKKSITPEDHKKFIAHFFKKIILSKTAIHDHFESNVLRWAEDREIVKGLVEKTIKSLDGDTIALFALSLNWDEDKEFIETLYNGTAQLGEKYKDLIANNTRNWEVERLPLTDRVILEMAIAELIHFPSIPVKVTINEYIELAKVYSTPKSRQFINGILDVIAKDLKDKGDLKKSGRGLIDNK